MGPRGSVLAGVNSPLFCHHRPANEGPSTTTSVAGGQLPKQIL